MKTRLWIYVATVCCLATIAINCSWASFPTTIVDSGPVPGGYRVEWVPSGASALVLWTPALDVPFTDISGSLHFSQGAYTDTVHGAESKGFYQVEFVSPPGLVLIPAGILGVDDPDFGFTQLNVPSDLYMDQTEITHAEWGTVRSWAVLNGYSFSSGGGSVSDYPKGGVGWLDCVKWCNARSEMENRTPCYTATNGAVYRDDEIGFLEYPDCDFDADGYRLPTEMEWEYAARSGSSTTRFPWGDTISHAQANYYSSVAFSYDLGPTPGYHPSYSPGTAPVGSFSMNGYGLFDMVGNVQEWCWDWGEDNEGPLYHFRKTRGGSYRSEAGNPRSCRLSDNASNSYSNSGSSSQIGFRCVRLTD